MSRTFVLGDIHGAYNALQQCIERSGFQKDRDRLIFLGDVCDGWPQTKECVEELMTFPHLIHLLGNHDVWFLEWMVNGTVDDIWLMQGGQATVDSYKDGADPRHIEFMEKARTYFEEDGSLFVHAGIPPGKLADECTKHELLWDRTLPYLAKEFGRRKEEIQLTRYKQVYIGHTPISFPNPQKYYEVWMMDTGAGWTGVLSMMNVETKECFMSDPVPTLYPGVQGRQRL